MKNTLRLMMVVIGILALAACSGGGSGSYTPPDLSGSKDALTIGDTPIGAGESADGRFPADGRILGYLFQGRAGEVYDLVLARLSGNDVPALALYAFQNGGWSTALVWATADAAQISISGWAVPADGTYLVLVDVVSGDRTGTFRLTLTCTAGCEDPLECTADSACPAGQVCWNGLCFDQNVECQTDADCHPSEVCERGFCVASCHPAPEVCDGWDNDCDGVIDEGCEQQPCTSDSDCPAGTACLDGQCQTICLCAMDADCPVGMVCVGCQCIPGDCPDADQDGFSFCTGDCNDLDAAVFPGAIEACDRLDNDCDGIVDEGCGGPACASDSDCPAGQVCWEGVCLDLCAAGAECPAGTTCCAGICAELSLDPSNCGACGLTCAVGEICLDGTCQGGWPCSGDSECLAGQACCGGECADLASSPTNCGACNLACAAGETCLDGRCFGGEVCQTDSDCDDGNPGTVDYCIAGQCVYRAGCAGDADCPQGQVCMNGLCVTDCTDQDGDGYCAADDCDDGDPTVNPGAFEICDGLDNDCDGQIDDGVHCAVCRTDSECVAGQSCCGGVCTELATDPINCGACDMACAAGETCLDGVCQSGPGCLSDADCDDAYSGTIDLCVNGTCVHELACTSDSDCMLGEFCVAGRCVALCTDIDGDGACAEQDCDDLDPTVFPGSQELCDSRDNDCDGQIDEGCSASCSADNQCAAGLVCCAGQCADIANDPLNCGGCSLVCAAGQVCYGGVCMIGCTADSDCDDGNPNTADYCVNGTCTHR